MKKRIIHLAVIGMMALSVNACVGRSQPSRYYMLTPTTQPESGENLALGKRSTVGIGPIDLPKYLDRTNLVYRSGENQAVISEFDSWAEPLSDGIQRVLVANIGNLVDGKSVVVVSRQNAPANATVVSIGIEQFECNEQSACLLAMVWGVNHQESGQRSPITKQIFRTQAASSSASDQSKALSQLLGQASAGVVQTLEKF